MRYSEKYKIQKQLKELNMTPEEILIEDVKNGKHPDLKYQQIQL